VDGKQSPKRTVSRYLSFYPTSDMYSGHPKNTADIIALGFNPGFFEYQEKNAMDTDPILVSLRLSNVRGKDGETIPIFLLL